MEDDVGIWVTFGVPPGHHLHGMFVPVDRDALPPDTVVHRVSGNVFGRATKPTMAQIRDAVAAARREAACVNDAATGPAAQPASSGQTAAATDVRDEQQVLWLHHSHTPPHALLPLPHHVFEP